MTWRLVVAALLAALVSACAGTPSVKLADQAGLQLQGRQIQTIHETRPSFVAMTAGKGMFAAIGAVAAIGEGNELVRQHEIEDPALHIEAELAKYLQRRHGVGTPGPSTDFGEAKPDDLAKWAREHGADSLILDVQTLGWNFIYFPTTWSKYRVIYNGRVQLIDSRDGRILAQHQCNLGGPENADVAPTYDELLENGASLLKTMLRERAELCVTEVTTGILG